MVEQFDERQDEFDTELRQHHFSKKKTSFAEWDNRRTFPSTWTAFKSFLEGRIKPAHLRNQDVLDLICGELSFTVHREMQVRLLIASLPSHERENVTRPTWRQRPSRRLYT